jgi:uncharacterized surface protein with fasciclin (FAS1) repeats
LYHVLGEEVFAKDLSDGDKLKTLEGKRLDVTIKGKRVFLDNANSKVIEADLEASNG